MFLKIANNKEKGKPTTPARRKGILILIIIFALLLIEVVIYYFDVRNDSSEELERKIEWQRNYFNVYD